VIATNIKEYFPALLRTLFTLFREKKDGDRIELAAGDHDLAALLRRHAHDAPARVRLSPEDPAVLLMSGGTTGTAKAALGTHGAYVLTGLQIKAWNASVLSGHDDVCFVPLPFSTSTRTSATGVTFVGGATLALRRIRDLNDLSNLRASNRRFSTAYRRYRALLNHPDKAQRKRFKSIRICFRRRRGSLSTAEKPDGATSSGYR
jgi:long-chain acyl-CoA synthetase